jgi:hypothetical protein
MSQKIADVLGVLDQIRRAYGPGKPDSVRDARIRAIKAIALARSVTYQTIGDAYLRRLKPDIDGTPAFDVLVQAWLDGTSDKLRRILLGHALDRGD